MHVVKRRSPSDPDTITTSSPKLQPTYFLSTVVLLRAHAGLLRVHITRFRASEVNSRVRYVDDDNHFDTVASWEKLWELRAISTMIPILTFLRMIKVRWAERWLGSEGHAWIYWQRTWAFRLFLFSVSPLFAFSSRVTPRVPCLALFYFTIIYYIHTYLRFLETESFTYLCGLYHKCLQVSSHGSLLCR